MIILISILQNFKVLIRKKNIDSNVYNSSKTSYIGFVLNYTFFQNTIKYCL